MGQDSIHVYDVEVPNIGRKQRVNPRSEGVDISVKRGGVHSVISLAAKVKVRNKKIRDVFFRLDTARGVIVELVLASVIGGSRTIECREQRIIEIQHEFSHVVGTESTREFDH